MNYKPIAQPDFFEEMVKTFGPKSLIQELNQTIVK